MTTLAEPQLNSNPILIEPPKKHALTVEDCIHFVRSYRMLHEWDDLRIAASIALALKQNALAYMTNEHGQLTALVWGRVTNEERHDSCYLHIVCIAGFAGCLSGFIAHLKRALPFVTKLTGNRYGNLVSYDL